MTIHHSARYQVKAPEAGTVKAAIAAFAEYVANEPGSKMPTAWQQKTTPPKSPASSSSPASPRSRHTAPRTPYENPEPPAGGAHEHSDLLPQYDTARLKQPAP